MTEAQAIEAKLKEAFDLVADSLIAAGYPERVKGAYELIDANESAIALEIMCSNLHDFECSIPVRAYDLFAEAGVHLKVNSSYWEMLKLYVRVK
jgi:hypothetical protein